MRNRARGIADIHQQRLLGIGQHLGAVILDTPGRQQWLQIGGAILDGGDAVRAADGSGVGIRVEEHHGLAAAQHVLVDGVQHLLAQLLRMHEKQNVDGLIDGVGVRIDAPHLIELAHGIHEHPGLGRLHGLRIDATVDRQAGEEADNRQLGVGDLGDQLGKFILQELFLIRADQRDGLEDLRRDRCFRCRLLGWLA